MHPTGKMLIMLNPIWDSWGYGPMGFNNLVTLLTFPLWEATNASDRGSANNVNNVKSLFSQKMLPTGEMLIMLIMLNPNGDFGDKKPSGRGNVNKVNNVKSISGFPPPPRVPNMI